MDILIRKAGAADMAQLQELGTELMLSEKQLDGLLERQWYFGKDGKEYLLREIKGRGHICFVAEIEGRIIGYASCRLLKPETWRPVKRAELDNLVVTEKHRNHGVGHKLVAAFLQWSKDMGAVKAKVVVNALNEDGIRFYEDSGFRKHLLNMEADI